MNKILSDMELILALKENVQSRNQAIGRICGNVAYKTRIYNYIKNHGGSLQDAEEVFQDGVLNFVKSVLADKYSGESGVEGYLFGICRYLWYRKFHQSIKHYSTEFSEQMVITGDNRPDILLIEKEKHEAVTSLINKLGKPCKKILSLWASGYSHREISRKMGYTEQYSRLRLHRCKRRLEKLMDRHPELLDRLK